VFTIVKPAPHKVSSVGKRIDFSFGNKNKGGGEKSEACSIRVSAKT
jgi:hypothetical protein